MQKGVFSRYVPVLANAFLGPVKWPESDVMAKSVPLAIKAGLINFVSRGYGGRTSDMEVIRKSDFLAQLKPGSVVMADRDSKALSAP